MISKNEVQIRNTLKTSILSINFKRQNLSINFKHDKSKKKIQTGKLRVYFFQRLFSKCHNGIAFEKV